jgi:hypothetical protein
LDDEADLGFDRRVDQLYTVSRRGQAVTVPPSAVRTTDWVLGTDNKWYPASRFGLGQRGVTIGNALRTALGLAAIYKLFQAVTDEEFDTVEYPAWFRATFIEEHVEEQGCCCPACDRRVRERISRWTTASR